MKLAAIPRSVAFQRLIADRSYDIEFNGYLSNHAKHAIIALQKLDAPEPRLEEYWDMYTTLTPYNLKLHPITEPWDEVVPVTKSEWSELRGRKEKWPNMCKFLETELNDRFDGDVNDLVATYAPDLLPGLAGALTHGIIHTGWALDAAADAGSPWMIIEGLAYLNFSYLSVHPENFVHGAEDEPSPVDSIRRIAKTWHRDNLGETWIAKAKSRYDENSGFHAELIPAGFQWQLSKVLSQQHEVTYSLPTWLDTMEVNHIFEQLYKTTVLLYLMTLDADDGHGNFLVLHLITSLWGLEQVLKVTKDDGLSRSALKCYYSAMVSLIATSAGGFPSLEVIDQAVDKYGGDDKTDSSNAKDLEASFWPKAVKRAIPESEEHNIKLVYVARELWRRYRHWAGFRDAAGAFTITPNIGPSSVAYKA